MAVKEGSTLRYVHSDHLGSSSVSTDTAGAEVGDQTYLPYGDERSSRGTLGTERRFTGQRFDGGSGLYLYQGSALQPQTLKLRGAPLTVTPNFNGRYYDVAIGRFIQPDPIVPQDGSSQAHNRYTYVSNNPSANTDPDGHFGFAILLPVIPVWVYGGLAVSGACAWTNCITETARGTQEILSNVAQRIAGEKKGENDLYSRVEQKQLDYIGRRRGLTREERAQLDDAIEEYKRERGMPPSRRLTMQDIGDIVDDWGIPDHSEETSPDESEDE